MVAFIILVRLYYALFSEAFDKAYVDNLLKVDNKDLAEFRGGAVIGSQPSSC
jgi:hypothetical protein